MKTLSVLKKDLEFNTGLSSLIEVLKTISVQQYRALEHRLKLFDKFVAGIDSFIGSIDITRIDHPFLQPRAKAQIVVAVTSDSGLLGGLNMQVVNAALKELEQIPGKLVVVGERGKAYARDARVPFAAFPGVRDEERHAQAMQLRDYVVAKLAQDGIGIMKIVYPRPISFTVQRVEMIPVLPFSARGGKQGPLHGETIFESQPADILEYLVYLWMGQKLYEVFGLSRLSEFAARYVHLEESADRLKKMDSKLRMEYFRVRHEIVDRNMRELFAARLLFTSKQ